MAPEIEALDKRLLNAAQTAFPLCARPWAALGEAVGLEEPGVIRRLQALKQRQILRQVSAIFDSRALGYRSALVAARAEAKLIGASAAVVSAHPGVSHNYQREHAFNLWFTLAVPPGTELRDEADRLGAAAGLLRWEVLPALRSFRIGVAFDLESGRARALASAPAPRPDEALPLDEFDKAAVRVLQTDLPLAPRPFDAAAAALGWDLEQLFDWMAEAGRRGWLRRFAAVLRHREAGFGEGGMGVWSVPQARVAEVGAAFAADPAVTHCYERPPFEGWPYNVFTMVHGSDRRDCQQALGALGRRVEGWTESAVLFSAREFKKERVRYFLEAPAVAGAPRLP